MKSIRDMQFWVFYFLKQKICAQRCGRINFERMAIVEIILLKRVSAIYISCNSKGTKLQGMYGDKKKQHLGIPKNGYQVYFISDVHMNLFVLFMKAKVYKVESCTIYFALNFHTNL